MNEKLSFIADDSLKHVYDVANGKLVMIISVVASRYCITRHTVIHRSLTHSGLFIGGVRDDDDVDGRRRAPSTRACMCHRTSTT